jgi:hypothetical protein
LAGSGGTTARSSTSRSPSNRRRWGRPRVGSGQSGRC